MEHVQTVLKTSNVNADAKSYFEDRETMGYLYVTNFTDLEKVADDLTDDEILFVVEKVAEVANEVNTNVLMQGRRFLRFSVSLKKFNSTKISTESSARIKSIFTTSGLTQTPSSVPRFSSVKYAKKMRMEKSFVMKQTVLRVPRISLQTIRMQMSPGV